MLRWNTHREHHCLLPPEWMSSVCRKNNRGNRTIDKDVTIDSRLFPQSSTFIPVEGSETCLSLLAEGESSRFSDSCTHSHSHADTQQVMRFVPLTCDQQWPLFPVALHDYLLPLKLAICRSQLNGHSTTVHLRCSTGGDSRCTSRTNKVIEKRDERKEGRERFISLPYILRRLLLQWRWNKVTVRISKAASVSVYNCCVSHVSKAAGD